MVTIQLRKIFQNRRFATGSGVGKSIEIVSFCLSRNICCVTLRWDTKPLQLQVTWAYTYPRWSRPRNSPTRPIGEFSSPKPVPLRWGPFMTAGTRCSRWSLKCISPPPLIYHHLRFPGRRKIQSGARCILRCIVVSPCTTCMNWCRIVGD